MAICQKKQTLLLAWQAAAQAYSAAVSELVQKGNQASVDDYEALRRQTERARTRTADTRNAFDHHMDEHGC